jgi:hypothetical protein
MLVLIKELVESGELKRCMSMSWFLLPVELMVDGRIFYGGHGEGTGQSHVSKEKRVTSYILVT